MKRGRKGREQDEDKLSRKKMVTKILNERIFLGISSILVIILMEKG